MQHNVRNFADPNVPIDDASMPRDGLLLGNLSNAAYHASAGISKSGLDLINQSPAHFKVERKPPTRPMAIGSAVHAAVLEPDEFARQYVMVDAKDRRAKAWKDAVQEFGEEFCLMPAEAENIAQVQRAIRNHKTADELTSAEGFRELSAFVQDPETGALVRSRFDLVTTGAVSVDLKTTRSATAEDFSRSIANFRYHVQAAFYSDVFEWITGEPLERFWFVCVETEPPYTVACYYLDDESIAIGRHEYRENLNRYAACLRADNWPKYSPDSPVISLPGWKLNEYAEAMEIAL